MLAHLLTGHANRYEVRLLHPVSDKDSNRILNELKEYRKRRRLAWCLLALSLLFFFSAPIFNEFAPLVFSLMFALFIIAFICFGILININCFKKCPRCGKTFCKDGLYIKCWAQKCVHCDLNLMVNMIID